MTRRQPGPKPLPILDRVAAKVALNDDGCLIWLGSRNELGYGRLVIGSLVDGTKRAVYAHRLVYEMIVSPIEDGFELDHLCRVPSCVHPQHLEPVTHRENLIRSTNPVSVAAKRDRCAQGHLYTAENLRVENDGSRRCRTCTNIWARARRERLRGAA